MYIRHLLSTLAAALAPWRRVAGLALLLACVGILQADAAAAADCRADPQPGVDWTSCKKRLLMLDDSNLEGADLSGADLSMTDLSRTNIKKANFTKTMLVRASLADAKAEGANFERTEGYRSNLSGISAPGASFVSSEMQRANFSDADLRNADFTKAELGRAIFYKAKLANVHFAMTNLSRANFHNVAITGTLDFANAFLFLTRIEGVDLSNATGLKQDQIALACGDNRTKLPPDLHTPEQWPCDDDDP